MNPDEEDRSIDDHADESPVVSNGQGTPSSSSSPQPAVQGEMDTSLSISRPPQRRDEPRQHERNIFQGGGRTTHQPAQDASPVRVCLSECTSSQHSIHRTLSSGYSSSLTHGGLEPALFVGVNPQIVNDTAATDEMAASEESQELSGGDRPATETSASGSVASAATSRSNSVVDRDVLIMREAADLSSEFNPTPLGRQRRLSLFERAHSTTMYSSTDERGGDGGGEHRMTRDRSDRSTSSVMLRSRTLQSTGPQEIDSSDDDEEPAAPRDKYNTVLRDWLMHVLEKDDQHDAEVRHDVMDDGCSDYNL